MLETFQRYFYYDETSKSCLRWKQDVAVGNQFSEISYFRRLAGNEAGTINKSRSAMRWKIKFRQKGHFVSRIIWTLFHGEIADNLVIDHLDGNSLNNQINNLRLVSQRLNSRNSKKRTNNTSGFSWISVRSIINKHGKEYRYFCVKQIGVKEKYFSITKLGEEKALQNAQEYLVTEQSKLTDYTERHGK